MIQSINKFRNKYLIVILLHCIVTNVSGSKPPDKELLPDKDQDVRFSALWVNYHERVCPLQTLAIDFTTKLTGKPKYKNLNADRFFISWLFYPKEWQSAPVFEIKHPELKKLINSSGTASFLDFFNSDNSYKLEPFLQEMYSSDHPTPFVKEAVRLDEKIQLVGMLHNGSLLKIFPFKYANGQTKWFSPMDELPENTDKMESLFVRNFFAMYAESLRSGKKDEAQELLKKVSSFQYENAGSALPSRTHLKVEILNNKLNLFSWLFKINLFIGLAGIFFFIFYTIQGKDFQRIQRIFSYLLLIIFILQTAGLCLRGYIGGRLPMSNGYETMLFIAWCAVLIGLLARKYSFIVPVFSFLLSGFTLLVAHIGSMNPQITPLVPVLQSPLLSIHVFLIMVSYGLCGFMLLNSLMSLIIMATVRDKSQREQYVLMMKEMSELFMFPATFFMAAGIFVGAIWANVSWGRYWGWDPKEVWALITFMLMSFTFHGKTLKWFNRPVIYHLFVIIIFASVLMTYFGVNYILGGRHSYAGG